MAKRALLLILALGFLGCSNQWREGEPDRTPQEMMDFLSEIESAQSSGVAVGNLSSALQFKDEAVIYFADAPSNVALIPNLVSFPDFSWMGSGAEQYDWYNTTEARVFFLDRLNGDTSDVGLVIGLNKGSGYQYFAFSGTGSVQGGEFVATLDGPSGQIQVSSFDTSDGALSDIIQLKIYDGSGQYLGKISTLIGYY